MVKPLPRRTFLRGMGTAMALPFLECMMPKRAYGAPPEPTAPRRFLAFYVPNGIHMPAWTPTTEGPGYALSPIMASLAPVKDDILVLSGLDNLAAIVPTPGDHARGTGSFLTCKTVVKTEGANIQNGLSLDQRLAQVIGPQTTYPSLELGAEGGASTGNCDSGYSCAYSRNISWAGPATPMPKEVSAKEAFDRLFAGYDSELTSQQVALRRKLRLSVLDFVLDDAKTLRNKVGVKDRLKLDEYMESVYALETKISKEADAPQCYPGPKPASAQDFQTLVTQMCDIMVLAFQCDMTRIITFMTGNAGSSRVFNFLGVTNAHHYLSHHEQDPVKQADIQTINTWEVEPFSYLLQKMKAIQEPDGTLLDNSLVFFSSEVADGQKHHHVNLPVILAGKGGGVIKPGRHINYTGDKDNQQPIANLYISIMNTLGVSDQTFGMDGTAPLTGLT